MGTRLFVLVTISKPSRPGTRLRVTQHDAGGRLGSGPDKSGFGAGPGMSWPPGLHALLQIQAGSGERTRQKCQESSASAGMMTTRAGMYTVDAPGRSIGPSQWSPYKHVRRGMFVLVRPSCSTQMRVPLVYTPDTCSRSRGQSVGEPPRLPHQKYQRLPSLLPTHPSQTSRPPPTPTPPQR